MEGMDQLRKNKVCGRLCKIHQWVQCVTAKPSKFDRQGCPQNGGNSGKCIGCV